MPSSTATMRSKAIVAPAVIARTNASERVENRTARTLWTSTIRIAVSMSTPASAASGIRATSEPPARTTRTRTSEWTIAETRVRAPARTFTAVRAIAPVAGMPPKRGEARFASPCPNSSRSGSWRAVSDIPSATFADSRLSMAASAATAIAAPKRSCTWPGEMPGNAGIGSESGSAPMRATCHPAISVTTVATTTASNDAGKARCSRGARIITAIVIATTRDGGEVGVTERVDQRASRDRRRVLAVGLRDTERVGYLLEEDDHRDPDGESLDDRPRHVREEPTEPRERRDEQEHPGHESHDVHGVDAVPRHDGDEHNCHRARRARDLHVGSAEDRRRPSPRRSPSSSPQSHRGRS